MIHNRITNNLSKKLNANDGLGNVVKGIGGQKDVIQNTVWVKNNIDLNYNYHLAEELYCYNWLVGNIADIPAAEATRAWCEIDTTRENQQRLRKVLKFIEKLEYKQLFKTALSFADLLGVCAIYMIVNDGQHQSKPLNKKNIRKNSLKVKMIEKSYMTPIYNFTGEIEHYQLFTITGQIQIVHKSRFLFFTGLEVTEQKRRELNCIAASRVQRSIEPIISTDTALNAIVNMLTETNVNIYKLNDLTGMLEDNADDDAIKKIMLIDKAKSYLNSVILDKEDDVTKLTNDFKDLHQVHNATLINVAGSSMIPAVLLLGKSPDGMNASGSADLENFYKKVNSKQTDKIEPKYREFIDVASYSVTGEGLELDEVFWNPLTQESLKEKAERLKIEAETDEIHLANETITKEQAQKKLARSNTQYEFLKEEKNENTK